MRDASRPVRPVENGECCILVPGATKSSTRAVKLGVPVGELLARAGDAQHGVVARRQLLARGLTSEQIKGLLARGHLRPLYVGVYAVGHGQIDQRGRWHAAVLACGTGAVLSHRSAAEALGLRWRSGIAIEVTRPRAFRPQDGVRCHRAVLRADGVGELVGIPVTSPVRTVLDLAALGDRGEVDQALHEIQVGGVTDAVSFDTLLARHEGHRGAALLRRARASRAPIGAPRNVFERAFVAFLDEYGLPRPALNATLALRGRFYEVDALWRRERLAAELDAAKSTGPTAPSSPTANATASSPTAGGRRGSPGASCATTARPSPPTCTRSSVSTPGSADARVR